MNILEHEIEDIIWQAFNSNRRELAERGLCIPGFAFRQFNLGSYGIPDIVSVSLDEETYSAGKYRTLIFNIYELKKEVVNFDTLGQALKYAKGIEKHMEALGAGMELTFNFHLIGKKIDLGNTNFCYASDYLPNVHLYKYKLDLIKGITFIRETGYHLTKANIQKLDVPFWVLRQLVKSKEGVI